MDTHAETLLMFPLIGRDLLALSYEYSYQRVYQGNAFYCKNQHAHNGSQSLFGGFNQNHWQRRAPCRMLHQAESFLLDRCLHGSHHFVELSKFLAPSFLPP